MGVALLVLCSDVWSVAQHGVDLEEQIVEIHRRVAGHQKLVPLVHPVHDLIPVVCAGFAELLGVDELALRAGDGRLYRPYGEPLRVDIDLRHATFEQRLLVGVVVYRELSAETDLLPLAPQQHRAEGVECGGGHVLDCRAKKAVQPLLHFLGGLVGEGYSRYPVRGYADYLDQVGDTVRDDSGLAGAWAGDDQQRSVDSLDGLSLPGIQPFKYLCLVHIVWGCGNAV